jgi:hypothetical protein
MTGDGRRCSDVGAGELGEGTVTLVQPCCPCGDWSGMTWSGTTDAERGADDGGEQTVPATDVWDGHPASGYRGGRHRGFGAVARARRLVGTSCFTPQTSGIPTRHPWPFAVATVTQARAAAFRGSGRLIRTGISTQRRSRVRDGPRSVAATDSRQQRRAYPGHLPPPLQHLMKLGEIQRFRAPRAR